MNTVVIIIHILTAVLLVLAVLLQQGKGAEVSSTFGGSSQTIFGTSGGSNFFQKFTWTLAAIFVVTSLSLTLLGSQSKKSLFEGQAPTAAETAPAAQPTTPAEAPAVPADKK